MKKILIIGVILSILIGANFEVLAKGRSAGGGRSSSSGRTSSGYSGFSGSSGRSSGSSSLGGSSSGGISKSGVSTSQNRSYSGYSGSTASKGTTAKSSYIEQYYKNSASAKSYNTFKQELTPEQKASYDTSASRNYNLPQKYNVEDALNTKPGRISRFETVRPQSITINKNYFDRPLSYGSAFAGIWDLWFLTRASDLFWYHHWYDIAPYRNYFDNNKFAEMEARVKKLEEENIKRDPGYLEPGVDPDLQFSNKYLQQNPSGVYTTQKSDFGWTVFKILLIAAVILLIIVFIKRYRMKKAAANGRLPMNNNNVNSNISNNISNNIINPLEINKDSLIEFSVGYLRDKGMFGFSKIIELDAGGKKYARYILNSNTEQVEYNLDVFPDDRGNKEHYLYLVKDTIPFSQDFLEVAGQQYLDTPEGLQYTRNVMPDKEERIDGIVINARAFDIPKGIVTKVNSYEAWEYSREDNGLIKYLIIEKSEETGLFSILEGELVEDMFFKVYKGTSK